MRATVEWTEGSSNTSFNVNAAGTYSIAAYNHCCTHRDTIRISEISLPATLDLGADTVLCQGEILTLNATVTTDQIM